MATLPVLEFDDPNAFVDYPVIPQNANCPKCKGHGSFNRILNFFPLPLNKENTSENRYLYCHLHKKCSKCRSTGYLDKVCQHTFVFSKYVHSTLKKFVCHCGATKYEDSSD